MVRKIFELSLWRLVVIVVILYLSENLIEKEIQRKVDRKKQDEQRILLSSEEDSACKNVIAGKSIKSVCQDFSPFYLESKKLLSEENITFDCEALDARYCRENYQRYRDLADPESVYRRSLSE